MSAYIYFNLNEPPITVDPQVASSDQELLIVRNMYEGLLRKTDSGAIACGACESYSKKGLTYTFKLRDNLRWSDGTPITANDFLFGIKRAISPQTQSPFAQRLFSIANAEKINAGQADISSLGVVASDDRTVIFTLSYDDPDFKFALTTAPAMPCNQDFFDNSFGKYGREQKYTLCNGSYYMGKWNKEDFGIRLYRNDDYSGDFKAQNAAVFLSCSEDDSIELLTENSADMSFLPCGRIKEAKDNKIRISSVNNICWVLTVGNNLDSNLRKSLCLAISPDGLKSKLTDGFTPARTIFPKLIKTGEGVNGAGVSDYNIEAAKQFVHTALSKEKDKTFPAATLFYYNSPEFKPAVTAMVGHWQQNLSAFINIEASDSLDALQKELKARTLTLAVFPVKASGPSASEYLYGFGIDIYKYGRAATEADLADAQTQLLKDNTLFPLAFESTNIASTERINSLYVDSSNGYIDFSFVIKED